MADDSIAVDYANVFRVQVHIHHNASHTWPQYHTVCACVLTQVTLILDSRYKTIEKVNSVCFQYPHIGCKSLSTENILLFTDFTRC